MRCKYGEMSDVADLKWLMIERRIDFAITKLFLTNQINIPENLQFKVAEEKQTSSKNSLTLMYTNENIKSVYLEETNKILNHLPIEIPQIPNLLNVVSVVSLNCSSCKA